MEKCSKEGTKTWLQVPIDPLIGKHAISRQENKEAFVQPRGEKDCRLTFDDGVYELGTRIAKN